MTDFERVADEAEQTKEVIPADPDVRSTLTHFMKESSITGKIPRW